MQIVFLGKKKIDNFISTRISKQFPIKIKYKKK